MVVNNMEVNSMVDSNMVVGNSSMVDRTSSKDRTTRLNRWLERACLSCLRNWGAVRLCKRVCWSRCGSKLGLDVPWFGGTLE